MVYIEETMTRTEATLAICRFVLLIEQERKLGLHPYHVALDYAKRSPEEQKRLFDKGLSKCDGYAKLSKHQSGRAFDLLLFKEGVYMPEWPEDFRKRYRGVWEHLGGAPEISWDQGHFE
jgi:hypothetical protein